MIPNLETTTFDSNVSALTHTFTVEMTPTLAKLLSSQTYPDKLLAAIREPLSNAYDAHVRAGTLDTPVRLHLPTLLEPYFALRDYGTGLSHGDVLRLFFSYGVSDKRSTNTEIGGLGIGAKAFFAYTDQAVITSYFNGEKRVYSACKNAAGLPQGMLISTTPTDEPNGIELQYAENAIDRNSDRFVRRVETLLTYLPLKVECNVPLNPPQPRLLYQTTVLGQRIDIPAASHTHVVVMGGIAYDVSYSVWADVCSHGFIIHLPIGRLEISASRETLSPTDADVAYLRELLRALNEVLRTEDWATRIDSCPDWLSACQLRTELLNLFGPDILMPSDSTGTRRTPSLPWRGLSTYDEFPVPGTGYASAAVVVRLVFGRRTTLHTCSLDRRYYDETFSRCYWIPTGRRISWKKWFREKRKFEFNECDLLLFTDTLEEAQNLAISIGVALPVRDGGDCRVPRAAAHPAAQPSSSTPQMVWLANDRLRGLKHVTETEQLVFCPAKNALNQTQHILDELYHLGIIASRLTAFSGYKLTEARATERYSEYPTLTEWLAQHPTEINFDRWQQQAITTRIRDCWRHSDWILLPTLHPYERLYQFPVTLCLSNCLRAAVYTLFPEPDITAELAAIQHWHETVLPTLPATVRRVLHGRTSTDHDIHCLYQELTHEH